MEDIKLEVQVREQKGKEGSKKIRQAGGIPAIIYGEGKDPAAVKVDRRAFERIERAHRGETVIIHLSVTEDGKKAKDYPSIVKEIQVDPVSGRAVHIDFVRISLTKKIEVQIPIVTKGEAIGVKQDHGAIEHRLRELDVVCLPTNIPQRLEVDVANLKIHDAIYVKDIHLPEGVTTTHDLEAVVLTVMPPIKEEAAQLTPAAEGAPAEPEVIKEKKKEEEAPEAGKAEKPEKAAEPKKEEPKAKG